MTIHEPRPDVPERAPNASGSLNAGDYTLQWGGAEAVIGRSHHPPLGQYGRYIWLDQVPTAHYVVAP